MRYIIGESITQSSLFPVSLDELISEDHVVRVIATYLNALDQHDNDEQPESINTDAVRDKNRA